jgi:hypothetical protein
MSRLQLLEPNMDYVVQFRNIAAHMNHCTISPLRRSTINNPLCGAFSLHGRGNAN